MHGTWLGVHCAVRFEGPMLLVVLDFCNTPCTRVFSRSHDLFISAAISPHSVFLPWAVVAAAVLCAGFMFVLIVELLIRVRVCQVPLCPCCYVLVNVTKRRDG